MAHTKLPRNPGIINDWIYANPEIFFLGIIAIGITGILLASGERK